MWMADRIYFVDTAIPADRKKRGREKVHVTFDGSRVFRVKRLTELGDAGEIFIDSLFPELYDEVLELLRRGAKVYLLRELTKLKKLRMDNGLRKSDENDAILLARIPRERFRPLTVEELEIKIRIWPLVRRYRWIIRWKKTLKTLIKHDFDYNFKDAIMLMEADEKKISGELIKQTASLPIYGEIYRKACETLGVKNSVELAILTLGLPLHLPLKGLKGLLGFTPDRDKRHRHKLRAHISSFVMSLYIHARKGRSVSNEVAEVVNHLPRRLALYKLQLMTLKALRIAYLTTIKPLTGG
jgi:hypothetical protein